MRFWGIARNVPFVGVVAVLYLIVVFINATAMAGVIFNMGLPSGSIWIFTIHDLFVILGLAALYVEILKATRTTRAAIGDHAFSLVVAILCMILFLLVGVAGTSTFFILTLFALVDVIAGFSVSLTGARRDVGYDPAVGMHMPPPP